jgi:hypothetical protein
MANGTRYMIFQEHGPYPEELVRSGAHRIDRLGILATQGIRRKDTTVGSSAREPGLTRARLAQRVSEYRGERAVCAAGA